MQWFEIISLIIVYGLAITVCIIAWADSLSRFKNKRQKKKKQLNKEIYYQRLNKNNDEVN